MENMQKYSAPVLRIAMCLVFLWFGINQVLKPGMWETYIPEFITNMGINATYMVYANGVFEICASILLAIGIFVRPVALLLSLHLFGIAALMGFTAIGVRDFGLSLATFTIFLHGKDMWCVKFAKNNKEKIQTLRV